MSYSHYFPQAYATNEIISDVKDILATTTVSICGQNGSDEPELDLVNGIKINGDALFGEEYETFHLTGTDRSNSAASTYCKTDRRPYDVVVAATLVSAHLRTGVSFSTDGTWEDWKPAVELYEAAVRPLSADELLGLEMIVESMVFVPKTVRNRPAQR